MVRELIAAIAVAVGLLGCASSLDRSPERLARIAADIVDIASQPRYGSVELTGMSVDKEYIIVGLGAQAPEFVTDLLSRYGSAVGFKIGYRGQPVACFHRDAMARPRGCADG